MKSRLVLTILCVTDIGIIVFPTTGDSIIDWLSKQEQKTPYLSTVLTSQQDVPSLLACVVWCSDPALAGVLSMYYVPDTDTCHCNSNIDIRPEDTSADALIYIYPTLERCTNDIVSGIPDSMMTGSTFFNINTKPHLARLDNAFYWEPKNLDQNQYVQLDFGALTTIESITTQGGINYWVTTYIVAYSVDCSAFSDVTDSSNAAIVFPGNNDGVGHMTNVFPSPIEAKCFRINPRTWYDYIGLRIGMKKC